MPSEIIDLTSDQETNDLWSRIGKAEAQLGGNIKVHPLATDSLISSSKSVARERDRPSINPRNGSTHTALQAFKRTREIHDRKPGSLSNASGKSGPLREIDHASQNVGTDLVGTGTDDSFPKRDVRSALNDQSAARDGQGRENFKNIRRFTRERSTSPVLTLVKGSLEPGFSSKSEAELDDHGHNLPFSLTTGYGSTVMIPSLKNQTALSTSTPQWTRKIVAPSSNSVPRIDTFSKPSPKILEVSATNRPIAADELSSVRPTQLHKKSYQHVSDDDMDLDSKLDSFFSPTFDRGRFPKERRRRGGKKYGTTRINDFRKSNQATAGTLPMSQSHIATSSFVSSHLTPSLPSVHITSKDELGYHDMSFSKKQDENDRMTKSLSDWHGLLKVFIVHVAPVIKSSSQRAARHLTETERVAVDKAVANASVCNEALQCFRTISFSPGKRQRKRIKKHIRSLYASRVSAVTMHCKEADRRSDLKEVQIPWMDILQPDLKREKSQCVDLVGLKTADTISRQVPSRTADNTAITVPQEASSIPTLLRYSESISKSDLPEVHGSQMAMEHANKPLASKRKSTIRASKFNALRNIRALNPWCQDIGEPPQQASIQANLKVFAGHAGPPTSSDNDYVKQQVLMASFLKDRTRSNAKDDVENYAEISSNDQRQLVHTGKIFKSVEARHDGRRVARILQGRVKDPVHSPNRGFPALLRKRELGPGATRLHNSELHLNLLEDLRPWRKWQGASSDIVSVAWASNSSTFAAGAAAHTNPEDLQYNRPCNLIIGDLHQNKLMELPEHRTHRPTPDRIVGGPNSMQETYNACDPLIYQTVNQVAFSTDGRRLYTASRDCTLKAWDAFGSTKMSEYTLHHGEVATSIDVCNSTSCRILATACEAVDNAIRIVKDEGDRALIVREFSSSRAKSKPSCKILPECIRWGPQAYQRYLLAGFTQWDDIRHDEIAREGHLCIWDVETGAELKIMPNSQSVSSIAWHPAFFGFITGGAPGHNLRSNSIKSCVRTYDRRENSSTLVSEFGSTALEIQEVTFHPQDSNIVTAGCTDGTVYVWDYRNSAAPVHTLKHGNALMELDVSRPRGECDTGVRLNLWGPGGSLFYSGSSDGVVKVWDLRRHPVDVLKYDLVQVGAAIQDGAFSPDFSHLLVGDAAGGIHILSSAPCGPRLAEGYNEEDVPEEEITFIRAHDGSGKRLDQDVDVDDKAGIQAANDLVQSGKITIHPDYGPGKGPAYDGPYATDDRRSVETGLLSSGISRSQVLDERRCEFNENVVAKRQAFHSMRKHLLCLDRHHLDPTSRFADAADPILPGEHSRTGEHQLQEATINFISEKQMMSEDHWWPGLGGDEIREAMSSR